MVFLSYFVSLCLWIAGSEDRKLGSPPYFFISMSIHSSVSHEVKCLYTRGDYFVYFFSSARSSEVFLHLSPSGTFGCRFKPHRISVDISIIPLYHPRKRNR